MKHFPESPTLRTVTAATALSIGMIGCGGPNNFPPEHSSKAQPKALSPMRLKIPTTERQLADKIKGLSLEYKNTPVKYLPKDVLCANTNDNPQQAFGNKLIVNGTCQPPIGEPSGVYAQPSFGSQEVGRVNDGNIVTAECIDPDGQTTTNVTGKPSHSETWVKIEHANTVGFISEVNLGYVDDSSFREC